MSDPERGSEPPETASGSTPPPPGEDSRPPAEPERGGEPAPTQTGPPAADAPVEAGGEAEQPTRIWDPNANRWVTEEELAASAPPPAAVAAPPPAGTAAAAVPRPAAPPARGVLGPLVAGVAGAVLAVVALLFFPGFIERSPTQAPGGGARTTGPGFDAQSLVSKVRPTVVNITVRGGGDDRAGSGIVLRPEGIVATSARLVQGATAVNVTFSSGLAVQADLVGIDLPTDVAVLRVDERELAAISRGTVGFLELGEPVVALSSPVEMYASVSTGVIASLGRPVSTPDGALLLDMIHVDAPLPATGTGGAVIREGGSVVGMVSAVTEGAGGTGFFVPIDLVYAVADQLASGRDEVVHPYIGAIVTPIDRSTGLPIDARGFVVAIVANGSPASEAGIEPSDIIVGIDGEPVEGTLTLTTKLLTKSPGDDIVLTIWRDGRTQDIRVEVGDLPEQP